MAFGKRGTNPPASRHVVREELSLEEPQTPGFRFPSEAVKFVFGVLMAIGLFYTAIHFLRQNEQHRNDTFGNAPNEASLRRARADTSLVARDLYNKCPIPKSGGVMIGGPGSFRQQSLQIVGNKLGRHVVFIDCVMRNERQRLCDPNQRSELVGQIGGYIKLRNEFLFFRDRLAPSHFDTVVDKLSHGKPQADQLKAFELTADRRVLEALNDLILAGYFIPKREYGGFFGTSIPKVFKGKLIEPIPGRNPCK
ncbi:MAG: hypothetical protein K0U74_11715 [Alphaproteobacteria bacterium]|nr:hypothetical protein [Alphaproteobacteria bacterium]